MAIWPDPHELVGDADFTEAYNDLIKLLVAYKFEADDKQSKFLCDRIKDRLAEVVARAHSAGFDEGICK